jgi:branched-chain amino acid transport system substrate-binding protein
LRAVGGDLTKADAFRAALKKANFASVRGNFRFGSDQEPIEDWYSTQVVKRGGKNEIVTIGKVARDLGNAYTSLCPL